MVPRGETDKNLKVVLFASYSLIGSARPNKPNHTQSLIFSMARQDRLAC
jgi:hypothetical protein